MTDVPVIIDLPFPCPYCGEEEVGRLITNRQAVCSFCGLTIDLGREQMIARRHGRSRHMRSSW
jgi:predicted RNA-binding Zn-ribbon protein involved in translation (DUF1610 family)